MNPSAQIVKPAVCPPSQMKRSRPLRRALNLAFVLVAVLALSPLAAAQARGHHKPKATGPSLKITALSVNEQPFVPGTKVTESQPINACYYVFGEAAAPHEMLLTALVKATGVPRNAPTSIAMTAPWVTQGFGSGIEEEGVPFSKAVFPDGKESVGTVAGGGSSADEYFRWISMQGGSLEAGDGTYRVQISTKVGGHTLEAHGSITIDC
jgi:hypothetical protein